MGDAKVKSRRPVEIVGCYPVTYPRKNPNVNRKCVHGHQTRREARLGWECNIDGRTEI